MKRSYVGIIKKFGVHYVALCPELNVASQGDSIEEAKEMLEDACREYLSYLEEEGSEEEINPISWEELRNSLLEDVELIKPSFSNNP